MIDIAVEKDVLPSSKLHRLFTALALLAITMPLLCTSNALADAPADFAAAIAQLQDADYANKNELTRTLAQLRQPGSKPVLRALLDGKLYVRSNDKAVFIGEESASDLALIDR